VFAPPLVDTEKGGGANRWRKMKHQARRRMKRERKGGDSEGRKRN
jgi:hypothetical protein